MATVCFAGMLKVMSSRMVTERLAAAKTIDTSFTMIINLMPALLFPDERTGIDIILYRVSVEYYIAY